MRPPIHASPLRRLLIANDDGDMRSDLARSLASTLRCTVETAGSFTAALAAVESHPPDAVLVDPSWTGLSSVAVVRALRASSSGSRFVIFVLTAPDRGHDATMLRDAGADGSSREQATIRPLALALLGLTLERQARGRHAQRRAAVVAASGGETWPASR